MKRMLEKSEMPPTFFSYSFTGMRNRYHTACFDTPSRVVTLVMRLSVM